MLVGYLGLGLKQSIYFQMQNIKLKIEEPLKNSLLKSRKVLKCLSLDLRQSLPYFIHIGHICRWGILILLLKLEV